MYTVSYVTASALVGVVFTLFDPDGKPLASTDQGYTKSWLEHHRDGLNRARMLRLLDAAQTARGRL